MESAMSAEMSSTAASNKMLWTGRIITGLMAAFMLLDGIMKIIRPDFVVKKTMELGFAQNVILPLGIVLLTSTILYLIPATSLLGAILLTGYLGGAVCTHVRAQQYGLAVIPTLFGVMIWLGLLLRENRLQTLLPLRR
jgi:hypothetical protein